MCDAVPCSHLEELSQLVETYDVLGIDEGQFVRFNSFPSSLSLSLALIKGLRSLWQLLTSSVVP